MAMTTQEIIDYYANLLIIQYIGKPKAYATIQALVKMMVMDQIPTQVMNAYNLIGDNPAVGVQLDVLGKYAGVKRTGFDFNGPVTLNDDDFLNLIKIAIVQNSSGSSLADIQNLLHQFFAGEIFVFDYQNMRMDYFMTSGFASQTLAEFFIMQGSLPKPMGVLLGAVIVAPTIDKFFGFGTYEVPAYNVSPFNTYEDFHFDWPWLDYNNSVQASQFFQQITTEDGDVIETEDGEPIITS